MLEDHVVDDVGKKLKKLGFRKKGMTWRRDGENGIEVFNLQRSQWGGAFYINLGVYFGPEPDPLEYQCTLRERVAHEGRTGDEVFDEVCAWFARQSAEAPLPSTAPTATIRVRHATFGEGIIVADQGTTVRVAFDDGTSRLLRRSFLEVV